jgi:hypothetical protein
MSDKPHDQPMPVAEHQALTTFLTAKGLAAVIITRALGAAPGGRSRREIEASLTGELKKLAHQ